jgi:protocatechuate 3,4-dioxygenase beta subunit
MSDEKVEAGDSRRGRRIDAATVARGAIEGTVRDKDGTPVVAQVCGKAASDDLAAEEIGEPVCVTSGTDGRYRLTGLLPASYTVGAAARGFIPASYRDANRSGRFDLGPGEERHGVDIVLQPGGVELAGVVKDVGGGPIGGALVRPELAMGAALHAAVRVRSTADGRFRIWIAPNELMLIARADGYADGWGWASTPGLTVEIFLMPESMLSGRVVQAGTGVPLPGARVASGREWSPDFVDLRGGRADDQGRFRLTRLPPGRYKPVATSPRGYGQARESVLLGLGRSVDGVVIEMHPAAMVTGRVLVAGSEAPCSSGWVSLSDAKRERHFNEDVGRDGRIAIEGVVAGRYRVGVLCHGFLAEEQYPDLVVAAGESPAELRWTVRAAARIRGTVRASDGAPLAGASVFAHLHAAQGNHVSPNVGHAVTDADGRFEMTGLVSGTYAVSASAREHPQTFWPGLVTLGEAGDATVDIRLDVGGDLLGEVVDEKGHPVAGVGLMAEWSAGDEDEAMRSMLGIPAPTTADDGSFAVRGLRPGTYRLSADRGRGFEARSLRSRGKAHADDGGEKIEVTAGKTVRASLVVDSHSGVIRGRVVDGRGGVITDALVDAERESGWPGAAREAVRSGGSGRPGRPIMTDTDGRFEIEKLAPGTYTLRAHRRGGGEALAEGVAVGAHADLTIRQTGSIAGKVVSDGAVPDEMTIVLADWQTGFSRRERFFRTAGEFALRDLPPGRLAVAVRTFDGTGDAEVELAEGQNLTGLVVRVVGRATVTGRVVSLDEGKPLPGYVIEVAPHAPAIRSMMGFDGPPEERLAGPDGRFVVEEVDAGRVQVFARPPDFNEDRRYGFVRRIVEVQGGRTTDVGDVRVAPIRARPGEAGDLGFYVKHEAAHVEGDGSLIVADVRPDGPAAGSGLVVDDVIVSVDGHDVRGDHMTYEGLSSVPPGTTVTLGLARGASVRITAGSVPAPRCIFFREQ